MRHKKIFFTFSIVYVFLFLLTMYSFSFFRGNQIDSFLEDKHLEYSTSQPIRDIEIDSMDDWSFVNSGRLSHITREYLREETEAILSSHSMSPFSPYKKALAYCEMWRVIAYANGVTIEEFWSFKENNMYSQIEGMSHRYTTFDELFNSEEYISFIDLIIESSGYPGGSSIISLYERIMAREYAHPFSSHVQNVKERLAEKAYTHYQEGVGTGDYIRCMMNSSMIECLSTSPVFEGKIFWVNEAGYLIFVPLHINYYLDLFLIICIPLLVSSLIFILVKKA
jgi:hypothetical protein